MSIVIQENHVLYLNLSINNQHVLDDGEWTQDTPPKFSFEHFEDRDRAGEVECEGLTGVRARWSWMGLSSVAKLAVACRVSRLRRTDACIQK